MNNSTSMSLEEQSLNGLKNQLVFTVIVYVVLSSVTLMSNTGVLYVMIKRKGSFRSNHYKFVIHTASVSAAQALFVVLVSGLYHVVQVIFGIPDYGTVLRCAAVLMFLELTMTIDQINVLIVAVDRMIAVLAPFSYKNLSKSKLYITVTLVSLYLFAICDASAKLALYTDTFANGWLPVCIMPNTRTTEYLNYRYIRGIFIGAATVLVYICAILLVAIKIRWSGNNFQQMKNDLCYRLLLATGTDGAIYTCTYFLSQIYQYLIIPKASPQARTLLGPVGMGFNLLCSTPRFIVFYTLNKEFKKFVKTDILRQTDVTLVTSVTFRQNATSVTRKT